MPNPSFNINDLVKPTKLVAQQGGSELQDMLNQQPETQFLNPVPTPPPTPTPAPTKKEKVYAT